MHVSTNHHASVDGCRIMTYSEALNRGTVITGLFYWFGIRRVGMPSLHTEEISFHQMFQFWKCILNKTLFFSIVKMCIFFFSLRCKSCGQCISGSTWQRWPQLLIRSQTSPPYLRVRALWQKLRAGCWNSVLSGIAGCFSLWGNTWRYFSLDVRAHSWELRGPGAVLGDHHRTWVLRWKIRLIHQPATDLGNSK